MCQTDAFTEFFILKALSRCDITFRGIRFNIHSVLQMRRFNRDKIEIFSIFLNNICCDPSLEHPCRSSANERSQHVFTEKLEKLSVS